MAERTARLLDTQNLKNFSMTSMAYNSADVFNTDALALVMSQSDNITAVIANGSSICNWRDKVDQKYSKLRGICNLHDFLLSETHSLGMQDVHSRPLL